MYSHSCLTEKGVNTWKWLIPETYELNSSGFGRLLTYELALAIASLYIRVKLKSVKMVPTFCYLIILTNAALSYK